jgi:hypothetical protein
LLDVIVFVQHQEPGPSLCLAVGVEDAARHRDVLGPVLPRPRSLGDMEAVTWVVLFQPFERVSYASCSEPGWRLLIQAPEERSATSHILDSAS